MFFYGKRVDETRAAENDRTWRWRQKFALFPVRVEKTAGRIGYILFDFYESRYRITEETSFGYEVTIERRRLGAQSKNYVEQRTVFHPPL
jgi:hypothetical protein